MLHNSIASSLFEFGFNQSIVIEQNFPRVYFIGPLDPTVPYDGISQAGFTERYGVPFNNVGNLVGERFSADVLNDLKNHPSNPLNLSPDFNPYSQLANTDSKLIRAKNSDQAAWDTFILPMHDSLFPPVPVPPDPPDPCPELPMLSEYSQETARMMTLWNVIGPGRRNRLRGLREELITIGVMEI